MYEISDYAESPDVEYPVVPPKQNFNSLSQYNANVAGSSASYASLNHNGKVSTFHTNDPLSVHCLFCFVFYASANMFSGRPSVVRPLALSLIHI